MLKARAAGGCGGSGRYGYSAASRRDMIAARRQCTPPPALRAPPLAGEASGRLPLWKAAPQGAAEPGNAAGGYGETKQGRRMAESLSLWGSSLHRLPEPASGLPRFAVRQKFTAEDTFA